MKPIFIQQGAEATISLDDSLIIKKRNRKSYRLPYLDEKLRKHRTKSEVKIMKKLFNVICVPKIIESNDIDTIKMEFIDGKKLSDNLENLDIISICKQLAEIISIIHNHDIIHGDLTTSNMILKDNKIFLIDFGLAFHSRKIEDKAVDLHVLKQALEAKHFTIAEKAIKYIFENYKSKDHKAILERIISIEKRGRYKGS